MKRLPTAPLAGAVLPVLLLACANDPAPIAAARPRPAAAAPGPIAAGVAAAATSDPTDGVYAGTFTAGGGPTCNPVGPNRTRITVSGGRFSVPFFRNEIAGTVAPDGTVQGVSSGGAATMTGRVDGGRFTADVTYPASSGGRGTRCTAEYRLTRAS